MIVNKYQGNGGGGGGSYVLPTATANRLGGIKVGSGVTITNDGTLSAEEATVIDLAVLSAMTSADRVAFWDEVYGKVSDGKSVFMKGLVYGEADRTAILPVVSFRPETSAVTHEGGNIFFGAKGDTDNIYFHINFGSDGSINPTDGMVKTFIAGKASAETLGLVKVGSGLTIDASGVLSATGGGSSDAYILNAVSELPESANTGDVVALYQEAHSSLPSGITYEGRSDFGSNQDRTGVRYIIPSDISLPGPENPLFLGNVSTDDNYYYFGMYAFNDSEYGVTFALSSDGDMETAWCAYDEGMELPADFECYVNYYESGNSRVYEVYTLYVPIAFYNLPSNVPEIIGVYQYDGSDWMKSGIAPATDEDLGGIIVGDGLSVDGNGVLSVPTASKNNLGIVKVGSGLTINSSGLLSVSSNAEVGALKGMQKYPSVNPQQSTDIGKVVSRIAQYGNYVSFRTDRVDYESGDPVFSLESGNFWVEVSTENSSYFKIDCGDNDSGDTFYLGDDPEITQNSALTGNYVFTAELSGNYFMLNVRDFSTENVIRISKDWITQSQSAAGVNVGGNTSYEFEGLQVYKGQDGWQPVVKTPRVIFLNKLTEQERILLYNELASKYDYNANSWTSAFTQDDYAFYIDLRDANDQQAYNVNDQYEGFFPMQVNRMHPSDYGGGAFFSGVEADRVGQGILINIRFVITYDGQVDKGIWWNNPGATPEYVFDLDITSAGTIVSDANWEAVGDAGKWSRLAMRYYYDTGWEGWQAFGTAPVKWVYDYITEVNSEVKLYYILTADVPINGTIYTGVWGVLQDHWYGNGDLLGPKLISWTSGSTITDPSYPPYVPQPNV